MRTAEGNSSHYSANSNPFLHVQDAVCESSLPAARDFSAVALAETYAEEGHDVRVLTRQLTPGESRHDSGTGVPGVTRVGWRPDGRAGTGADVVNGADAVVNLAGANLGDARWTPQRKARASRQPDPSNPKPCRRDHGVAGSSTGVHQRKRSRILRQRRASTPRPRARRPAAIFSPQLCEEWEARGLASAERSYSGRPHSLRCRARTKRRRASKDDDAVPFFCRRAAGIRTAVLSWIHRIDWIEMIRWIVDTPAMTWPGQHQRPQSR